MRILTLSFRNLNSLAGDWSIDFRAPEYEASGIFAITGPTGAGKSTILDAICLALYGSTPRLPNISKNVNDIMTRGTGDCYASSFAGALMRGHSILESASIAADFVVETIRQTLPDPSHWWGVKFEKALPYLIGRL